MIAEMAILIIAVVLIAVTIIGIIMLSPAIHRRSVQNRRDARDREIARLQKELHLDPREGQN